MSKSSNIIIKLDPAKPTEAYDTYWKFAFERQNVWHNRVKGKQQPFSDDPILQEYKFTNVYRASDRVSQYLIKHVIYNNKNAHGPNDHVFRILLFKLFNKIETWQLLEHRFGEINVKTFKIKVFIKFLDSEMNNGRTLYSNAYMMASGCKEFEVTRKHHAHLMLLEKMLRDNLPDKIVNCKKCATPMPCYWTTR